MQPLLKDISHQIVWDLDRLIAELESYPDESIIWTKHKAVNNTAGHLGLHLIGNLNHFFGHMMGGTDYKRDRELEFNSAPIPVSEIAQQIIESKKVVETSLSAMTAEKLSTRFPIDVFGFEMTYQYFIIRLANHLSYHLGQISYHRRILV
ncbi:MAG: DinB family protein [Salibacteraceae bacterium]|nr:DinB family protein [Salibacteraceae bacterium]